MPVPTNPSGSDEYSEDDWSAPTLDDFTEDSFEDLSESERRRIAQHFAWASDLPPENFTDLKLPHHEPDDGSTNVNGVVAAIAALEGARGGVDLPSDERDTVRSHLMAHRREAVDRGLIEEEDEN